MFKFDLVFNHTLSFVLSKSLHGSVEVSENQLDVRHVDNTEVLGQVCANDVAMFGEIDSEQYDLIFERVDAFNFVKGFSFFAKIAIPNVDPGSFISEKELL